MVFGPASAVKFLGVRATADEPEPILWEVVVLGNEAQATFDAPHLKKAVVALPPGFTEPLRVAVVVATALEVGVVTVGGVGAK